LGGATAPGTEDDTADEFSLFLHDLRTRELGRLPAGAKVVLSGGASGGWYFDWFQSHYPTTVERHIGVEAFAPEPDDLPPRVEWISASLGDLRPVESGSVDLVFGGQVIEHLWPDEISGFLSAAHRVLRRGGDLVLDSPNRRVTQAINWLHPEHTVEFTVDEIVELLQLAGFEDVRVRGVLLAYDSARHRYLTLGELGGKAGRHGRAESAAAKPEESFVWWAEATRGNRKPAEDALQRRVRDLFSRFRKYRLNHSMSPVGEIDEIPDFGRVIHAAPGNGGPMLFGPYIPMPPGSWIAAFDLAALDASQHPRDARAAVLEVTHGNSAVELGVRSVAAGDLSVDRQWSRYTVGFALAEATMGVEFRIMSDGRLDLFARASIDLQPAGAPGLTPRQPPQRRVKKWLSRLRERSPLSAG
jgi:SAM-dependent methyltransferase